MISPDDVRRIALSLPETEEKETWGEATFRVRNKIFATLSADGDLAGVKASLDEQQELIEAHPETFSISHYTGRFGWVTVKLDSVDPELMEDLIVDAWRRTAPKRLVKLYDAGKAG
jgi:hypothetical protein